MPKAGYQQPDLASGHQHPMDKAEEVLTAPIDRTRRVKVMAVV
jgi:hypothetical protein